MPEQRIPKLPSSCPQSNQGSRMLLRRAVNRVIKHNFRIVAIEFRLYIVFSFIQYGTTPYQVVDLIAAASRYPSPKARNTLFPRLFEVTRGPTRLLATWVQRYQYPVPYKTLIDRLESSNKDAPKNKSLLGNGTSSTILFTY